MAISWGTVASSEHSTRNRSSRLSLANFGAGIFDRDPGALLRTQLSIPRLDLDASSDVPNWKLDLARRLTQLTHSHALRWSLLKAITVWCDGTHL